MTQVGQGPSGCEKVGAGDPGRKEAPATVQVGEDGSLARTEVPWRLFHHLLSPSPEVGGGTGLIAAVLGSS